MSSRSSKTPVALIFTANGSGLGHISRAIKLANTLAKHKWSVLVVTGNPAANYFCCERGVDVVRMPCLEKSGNYKRRSRTGYSDPVNVIGTRKSLLLTLAVECRPSLFIVDHKPVGISGELIDTLSELRKRDVTRILVLRDFGGDHRIVKSTWDQDGAWSAFELYNQIIVLGDRGAYDWDNLIGRPRNRPALSYLGFLVAERRSIWPRRRRRGTLVLGGGGAHAYELFANIVNDLHFLLPAPVTICTGPLMVHEERSSLVASLNNDAIVKDYIPSLEHQLDHFEVVVSQAGSISTELAFKGVDTILVPRNQESGEQEMRAQYWAKVAPSVLLSDLDSIRGQIHALRKHLGSSTTIQPLRQTLPNLFVTPADVVEFILNEGSTHH